MQFKPDTTGLERYRQAAENVFQSTSEYAHSLPLFYDERDVANYSHEKLMDEVAAIFYDMYGGKDASRVDIAGAIYAHLVEWVPERERVSKQEVARLLPKMYTYIDDTNSLISEFNGCRDKLFNARLVFVKNPARSEKKKATV